MSFTHELYIWRGCVLYSDWPLSEVTLDLLHMKVCYNCEGMDKGMDNDGPDNTSLSEWARSQGTGLPTTHNGQRGSLQLLPYIYMYIARGKQCITGL